MPSFAASTPIRDLVGPSAPGPSTTSEENLAREPQDLQVEVSQGAGPTGTDADMMATSYSPMKRTTALAASGSSAAGSPTTRRPPTSDPVASAATSTQAPAAPASMPETRKSLRFLATPTQQIVLHQATVATRMAESGPARPGQILTQTESGGSLGSHLDYWVKPWNEADVDKDEVSSGNPHPHPHGGYTVGFKMSKLRKALLSTESCRQDLEKTLEVRSFCRFNSYRVSQNSLVFSSPRVSD